MELPRNYIQRERECDGISHSVQSGRETSCGKNAIIENSSCRNTFSSFCSERFQPPTKVLSTCDRFSKIDSTTECRSRGEVKFKSNFVSGNRQMSGFERACYEDFQTYIPEITHETQFIYPSKLCEDNTVYGCVSSSRSAVNHGNVLTHYPSSSSHKVTSSTRQQFYNDRVEAFPCEGSRKMTSATSNIPGSTKFKDTTLNSCSESVYSWQQEIQPSLHENLRLSNSAYQAPPNKVMNHFGQSLCPTVSIRVDISCPLSTCNCDKMSCCCRDAFSKPPVQHSHGNVSGKRNIIAYRPNVLQNVPRATMKACTSEFSHTPACSSDYTTGVSNWQLRSDFFPEENFKSFHQRHESSAGNSGCLDRLNSGIFDMGTGLQNESYMMDDKKSSQWIGSDCTENKLASQKGKVETLNSCAVKYDEKTRSVNFSPCENSCVMAERHVKSMDFSKRSQTSPKECFFPKTVLSNSYDNHDIKGNVECVELTPINPRKIFGQCRFQTTGNLGEKYSYAKEPPAERTKTWQNPPNQDTILQLRSENPVKTRNKEGLNETSLVMEPSSPIANLSNLVAKIHPDHGNIMTGKKNPKFKGK